MSITILQSGLEGVKVIANGAMSHRAHLRSVSIPDSVTVMGDGAFHCSGVKKVKLSKNIDRIPAECFYDCRLEVFIVPEGVVNVDDSALGHNDNLITVIFPKTLKNMGYNVFSGCPSLTRISGPRKSNFMNLKDMQKAGLRKGVRSTRENCIGEGKVTFIFCFQCVEFRFDIIEDVLNRGCWLSFLCRCTTQLQAITILIHLCL